MKRIIITIIVIVGLVGLGLVGIIFSGNPGSCNPKQSQVSDPMQIWQPVHLFLAGEQNRLILTDGQVTELVKTRLSAKVTQLAICFDNDLVWVTGTAENNSGWRLLFWIQGKPQLSDGRLGMTDMVVKMGNSEQIPGLAPLLSQMAQRKISDYLQTVAMPEVYRWQLNRNQLVLWRN